jgi:hypothetical protein
MQNVALRGQIHPDSARYGKRPTVKFQFRLQPKSVANPLLLLTRETTVSILRSRQHVGQDILLARHGNHICATRYDRRRNCIVARLDDGTFDTAPNEIAAGVLPATVSSVLREDGHFLAKMCALYLMFAVLLTAAVVVATWTSTDLTAAGLAEAYMDQYRITGN